MQNVTFDLSLISKYRSSLMGIATIGILMCHAAPNGVNLPPLLKSMFGLGQLGVDLFFFLSGFGLFYSLSKPYKSIRVWYHKRFLRIFVPYLIIYAPALLLICIQNAKPWWYYFYNLSTISLWFNDGGCWFIAMLVPLYLVAPLWKRVLDKTKYTVIPTVIICIAMFSIGYALVSYLSGFLNQALFFFIGMAVAKYVTGGGNKLNIKQILSLGVIFAVLFVVYKLFPVFPLFWVLFFPILFVTCILLNLLEGKLVNPILNSIGTISLESYLFNVTLIVWIDAFNLIPTHLYTYRYVFIVIAGIALSYVVKIIDDKILYPMLKGEMNLRKK